MGLQVSVDLLKQALPQFVPLEKMAEVQNRGLIGQGIRQPQPGEPPHRFGLVEQVLHPGVTEIVEQLHAVNPQHHQQWVRPAALSGLGVNRADALLQPFPGNQPVHPLQKYFPAGLALLTLIVQVGERWLVHFISPLAPIGSASPTMPHHPQLVQRIPK